VSSRERPSGVEAAVFAFLGNDVRLQILHSLYERTVEPGPMASAASYSTVRADVGVEDSGRFSYHLDKLTDRFITRHDGGYRLREAGREVVRLHRTGVLSSEPTVAFEPVEAACFHCGATAEAGYEGGYLLTRCPECPGLLDHELSPHGTLSALAYPPSGVESAPDVETIFRRAHHRLEHRMAMMGSGFCGRCGGNVTASFDLTGAPREGSGCVALDPADGPEDGTTEEDRRYDHLLNHDGLAEFACDCCGILRLTHPLHAIVGQEPVAGILSERNAEPGWERFAEVMRWPVTERDDRLTFETPDGGFLTVSEDLTVEEEPSAAAD